MPALFSLGQHGALEAVQRNLRDGELLFSYLDDIYVLCRPDRARDVFDLLQEELRRHTGIECHLGKTRVYNSGGVEPARVRELGPDVWCGGTERPPEQRGTSVLGTPLGTAEYVRAKGDKRLTEERLFWEMLPKLTDLQSAWLLLLNCAAPRSNYTSRTVTPSLAGHYAKGHDTGMWQTLVKLLGREDLVDSTHTVQAAVTTLPLRLGGLGLRSASRTSAAAFWASWADALPILAGKYPDLARRLCGELESGNSRAQCLREAAGARATLQHEGFTDCPTWTELREGAKPPQPGEDGEPGEYKHG